MTVLTYGEPTSLDAHLAEAVYPALFGCLDTALPEFGWVKHGKDWVATKWPTGFPYAADHKHPGRLMVYEDRPWWIKVHGHSGLRFLDYANDGRRPQGDEFTEAVRKLCGLAGVRYPERETTPEQAERARRREERRAALEDLSSFCQDALWAERGSEARAYLRDGRGLSDDQVGGLRLGLYLSAAEVRRHLKARGHSAEACRDASADWRKAEGFITIPWQDERGQALTVYARWPDKTPPLMKDLPGWRADRDELRAAWEKEREGEWDEPRVPKTLAFPGKDTKASPFCFDRARRAGHREPVLFEGVFDAAYLQARGETRAIASVAAQLNGEQLKTLKRCGVSKVFVCGDPDGGGDRGTRVNVLALAAADIMPAVVPRLPDGLDPDEFVRERGLDAWREWVGGAVHGYRYLARTILDAHGERRADDDGWVDEVIEEALAVARDLPADRPDQVTRYFLKEIAGATGAHLDDLREQLRERKGSQEKAHEQNGEAAGTEPPAEGDGAPAGFRWDAVTSAAFAAADYSLRWLVKRLLVAGQPGVIGGPQKSLKTSVVIDLAVSLASATPFLGTFQVYRPVRVAVLSGESGEFALRETALRVCAARGLDLAALPILWGFRLPQLANPADLAELQAGLRRDRVDVLLDDPLYLSLLAGQTDLQASNLYQMGPLLLGVARACLDAGATPILVHHTNRPAGASREPLELTALAYSGIAEFARQWLLLNRRESFDPGTGSHRLWLSAGGTGGQGGLWALDVEEGTLGEDFGGRRWEVNVRTAGEEREQAVDAREGQRTEAQARKARDNDAKVLNALDRLGEHCPPRPATKSALQAAAGVGFNPVGLSIERLCQEGIIEPYEVKVESGRNRKGGTPATAYRRVKRGGI